MRRVRRTKRAERLQSPLFSMIISLLLVGVTVGFVFGFGSFLQSQTYTGPEMEIAAGLEEESTQQEAEEPEYLKVDKRFKPCYVMICEVPPLGLWANPVPGEKTDASRLLMSGQIVYAAQRGTYKGQTYYKLSDGLYLGTDVTHAQPLLSYMEVDGYLAVTYISSSGVRLRRWADFDADNVVGAVYVGDKVQVKARVQTEKGASAYITEDGLYITSDAQYFDDYTTVLKDTGKDGQKTGSGTGDRKDAGGTDRASDRKDSGDTDSASDQKKSGDTGNASDRKESGGTDSAFDRKDSGDTEDAVGRKNADDASNRKDAGRIGGKTQSDDSTQTENSGGWDFSDPELNRQE